MFRKTLFFALTAIIIGSSFAWLHIKNNANLSPIENDRRWVQTRPNFSNLKSGDLIFRHSRGFISETLIEFNQKEKKYSHAGIIKIEGGTVYVFHAIGGEENKSNKLRKDLLSTFCNPSNVYSFSVYRVSLSANQRKSVLNLADFYYKKGLEFDADFDLTTDNKMYCTEFVYKTFSKALAYKDYFKTSTFSGRNYVACDNLYLNPNCSLVYSYSY